jgi:hypothetical protein
LGETDSKNGSVLLKKDIFEEWYIEYLYGEQESGVEDEEDEEDDGEEGGKEKKKEVAKGDWSSNLFLSEPGLSFTSPSKPSSALSYLISSASSPSGKDHIKSPNSTFNNLTLTPGQYARKFDVDEKVSEDAMQIGEQEWEKIVGSSEDSYRLTPSEISQISSDRLSPSHTICRLMDRYNKTFRAERDCSALFDEITLNDHILTKDSFIDWFVRWILDGNHPTEINLKAKSASAIDSNDDDEDFESESDVNEDEVPSLSPNAEDYRESPFDFPSSAVKPLQSLLRTLISNKTSPPSSSEKDSKESTEITSSQNAASVVSGSLGSTSSFNETPFRDVPTPPPSDPSSFATKKTDMPVFSSSDLLQDKANGDMSNKVESDDEQDESDQDEANITSVATKGPAKDSSDPTDTPISATNTPNRRSRGRNEYNRRNRSKNSTPNNKTNEDTATPSKSETKPQVASSSETNTATERSGQPSERKRKPSKIPVATRSPAAAAPSSEVTATTHADEPKVAASATTPKKKNNKKQPSNNDPAPGGQTTTSAADSAVRATASAGANSSAKKRPPLRVSYHNEPSVPLSSLIL